MRLQRFWKACIVTAASAAVMGAVTFAQVTGGVVHRLPSHAPKIFATPQPAATALGNYAAKVVPLWTLPQLPAQTPQNTAYFAKGGKMHRMAANGATIAFVADAATSGCASAVGTVLPTNCDIEWQAQNMPSGHTYQDYFVTINANVQTSSATAVDVTYGGGNGNIHCDSSTTCPSSVLATVGTYVLAVYDKTAGKWATVVYVSVGAVNVFGTYADSAATTPQTQFTASNTTNVYINAAGLTQGQNYVVYIESTQGPVFCEYIAPPGTPSATQGCDPTTSAGITAVVGAQSSAAITAVWPLSTSVPTGTYAVVLYDLTTSTRLAMRQVSITASGASGNIALTPVAGNAAVTGLLVTPATPSPGVSSIFAFDNTAEQSDKGWSLSASGLAASKSYTWTIHDPTGYVVQSGTQTSTSAGGLTLNWTFSNTQAPSNFISNVYTVQLRNPSGNVDASQAFKILGYNVVTSFTNPSGTALVLPSGGTAGTDLKFANDGDQLYGSGNGDSISAIYFDTGANGITVAINGVPQVTTGTQDGFSCASGYCQSTTFTDQPSGNTWNVHNDCLLNPAHGECTIIATPAGSNSLAANASLTISNLTFTNGVGSHCTSTCSGTTNVLPTHGLSYSSNTQTYAGNLVYFTNGFGNQYQGTASVTHYGYYDNSIVHVGQETHGYRTNSSQMTYTASLPFTQSNSSYAEEWQFTVTNGSTGGSGNITELQISMPTSYSPGSTSTPVTTDNTPPSVGTNTWTTTTCPGTVTSVTFCIQTSGSNAGIAPGGSQTFYIRAYPDPPSSFAFSDWSVQALKPTSFGMSAASTVAAYAPNTTSYDSLAIGAYSFNGNLITPGFSPTSQGLSTNNSETINVQNTSTAQDALPDYIDAITIDLPCANGTSGADCFGNGSLSSYSNMTSGWTFLGEQTNTPSSGITRYWFGPSGCTGYFSNASTGGPPSSTPPASVYSAGLCGSSTVTASGLAPGATFSVTANMQAPASAGTVTATMYAHGANGNAWSAAHTFNLSVTSVAAAAGFTGANGYPTASSVNSPNSPQVGADSNNTYGNAFTYTIKNNSAAGNNITSAIIEIPGKDISVVTPNDGTNTGGTGTPWTITNTPSISGTAYGCTVSAQPSGTVNGITYNGTYSASNTGSNGGIAIGGGSCSIPPGSTITINFDAKAPYTVNDSYKFPTTVNNTVTAAENWTTDTIMQVIETASLSVLVNPSNFTPADGAYSLTPSVNCAGCSFNQSTNVVDFGTVSNSSVKAGQDVLLVSINTDAGANQGWQLYVYCSGFTVGTSCNPATTGGAFTNELVTELDNTRAGACTNSCEPKSGMTFNNTTYTVIPSTSPGLEVMNTGSGIAASRDSWQALVNLEVNMGTEAIGTGNKSTIVYTFIGN